MRRRLTLAGLAIGLISIGVVGGFELGAQGQVGTATAAATPAAPADTAALRASYEQWRKEYKTWGRWGTDDNKGTSNLITPQKITSALKLARSGIVVSLAHPEPQQAAADVNANGVFHRTTNGITAGGTTDTYQVSYHGQTVAHMDTWCHFFVDGQMYNGTPVKDNITPENGCKKGSVMNWKDGIVTRAVLYDIAQLKGADWVEPGVPITRADLEAWEKKSGVKAGPGDVVLLYIGRWKRREKMGPWTGQVAGYYADTIPWMHERLPAFIGHDFNIDWNPRPGWEGMPNPIHIAVLNWMGINIVECLDLEQAAATARRLNRYEFLITFAPLPVEGGTGSPVNPLAIFQLLLADGDSALPQLKSSRRGHEATPRESAAAAAVAREALPGSRGGKRARISGLSSARAERILSHRVSGGRTVSVSLLLERRRREVGADFLRDGRAAPGKHRHVQGRSHVHDPESADLQGGGDQHGARLHRSRGPRHAAGRDLAARRHQLPDASRLGHGLHADLQHDRAAGGADAGRPGRNRLVPARDRVSLRTTAGRGHSRSAPDSDRAGVLRAARGDDAA